MVIDSSALLSILLNEIDARTIAQAIREDARRLVSAGTLLEASMVIESRRGLGMESLDALLDEYDAEVIAFTPKQAQIARRAFRKFGKGRHPANLNFGDCIAYALARDTGEPLLFKGTDFGQTDIDVVELPVGGM